MTNSFTLLSITALYALLLAGAGTLVTYGFALESSLVKRLSMRFIVGSALLPTLQIVLFEFFRLRVHPATVFAVGTVGVVLLAHDEWTRWKDARCKQATLEASGNEDAIADADLAARVAQLESVVLLLMMGGIFGVCFLAGTKFPVMEAWDPWGHALGAKYIWETGILRQPFPEYPLIHYVDAYPPLYDILMSFPCGLAGSINAPMKTTNALFVAVAIPAFYVLVQDLSRDARLAMIATILYAVIPSNLTRHVWGHSAATVYMLAGLAYAMRAKEGWRYIGAGAICFAGALLAAPTAGMKAGVVLILTAVVVLFISRQWFLRVVALGALALAISMIWFLPVYNRYVTSDMNWRKAFMTLKVAMDGAMTRHLTDEREKKGEEIPHSRHPFGVITKAYNLDTFMFFRPYAPVLKTFYGGEKVDSNIVPQGIGLPIIAFGLVFLFACVWRWICGPDRLGWREILLAWLAFSLVGVLGLGFQFFIWRFWLLFVPFAVIAGAAGLLYLADAWQKSLAARVAFSAILLCVAANAVCAMYFDATSPYRGPTMPYSPWAQLKINGQATRPTLDDGYLFFAVPFGIILWLGTTLVTLEDRAARFAFKLIAAVVILDALIAVPMRMQRLAHPTKDHIFVNGTEYEGYIRTYFETLPGSRIWPLSGEHRFQIIIGLDRECQFYRKDECEFYLSNKKDELSTEAVVKWLREHHYQYLVLDPTYQNTVTQKMQQRQLRDARLDPLYHGFLSYAGEEFARGNPFEKRVRELEKNPVVERIIGLPAAPDPGRSQFYLYKVHE